MGKPKKLTKKTVNARLAGERERVLGNIAAQSEAPSQLWWLSVAGEDGFRGAIIERGTEFLEALMRCNLNGINPGGEVQALQCPPEKAVLIPDKWIGRLLTRADCEAFDQEMEKQSLVADPSAPDPRSGSAIVHSPKKENA